MSSTRFIFRSQGDAVAFIEDRHVFALDGQTVGFIDDQERVYDRTGRYRGFLLRDGRVAAQPNEEVASVKPPQLREKAKSRPTVIPRRLPMPPLPEPTVEAIVVSPFEPERRVAFPSTVVAFFAVSIAAVVVMISLLANSGTWLSVSFATPYMLGGLAILASACALVASVMLRRLSRTHPKLVIIADATTAPLIHEELSDCGKRIAEVVETIEIKEESRPDLSRLASLLKAQSIDKVLIDRRNSKLINQLRGLVGARRAKDVQAATDFMIDSLGRMPLQILGANRFSELKRTPKLSRTQALLKRTFDIFAAGIFLTLQTPLLIITALAIKLDSPGPVLNRQERVGLGGRPFYIYKFRSLRTDLDMGGVALWANKRDPRITRVGAFIRRTRLDELPQLICVLRGHMSMVGPRPERPGLVENLKDVIPGYDLRHLVKPGITGWSQVRYSYGSSYDDARKRLEYDLYYIENQSVALDLLILFETVEVVLFSQGSH